MLEARGLVAGYGGSDVLQGVDITVEPGSITGVIGLNGAGKSTLLKVLMGFLRPSRGEVLLEGRPITRLRPDDRIRLGLAYVAQTRSSFPGLSVLENLRVGGFLVRDRAVLAERLTRVFERFPILRERQRQAAGLLSGGELRILEIGRFLMMRPRLVVLDEPSIGLAPGLVDMVYRHIQDLRRKDITFLIVEQNVRKLLGVASYVYALETGQNRYHGTPGHLLAQGHLAGLYLGAPIGESAPGAER